LKLDLGGTQMYTFDDCIVQSASAPRPAMDHGSPYVYHLTVYIVRRFTTGYINVYTVGTVHCMLSMAYSYEYTYSKHE
jgi:hypothetical protein